MKLINKIKLITGIGLVVTWHKTTINTKVQGNKVSILAVVY